MVQYSKMENIILMFLKKELLSEKILKLVQIFHFRTEQRLHLTMASDKVLSEILQTAFRMRRLYAF